MQKTLIIIIGPTAIGKTDFCVKLAQHFSTSVISADSRQFYRDLTIGTAKPAKEELQDIPHYFIDFLPIEEEFDVFRYEKEVLEVMETLFSRQNPLILTGGSGLYVKALTEGIDEIPDVSPEVRERLKQELSIYGLPVLRERLAKADPKLYQRIDLNNPSRVLRGLEVYESSGIPLSAFQTGRKKDRPFQIIKVGLERPRDELYHRINNRMDQMIEMGLFEEARKFYHLRRLNALKTVGYQEIFGFLDGLYDQDEAVRLLKRNSRRYAKRQLTWFKKDPEITWFHPDQFEDVINFLNIRLS